MAASSTALLKRSVKRRSWQPGQQLPGLANQLVGFFILIPHLGQLTSMILSSITRLLLYMLDQVGSSFPREQPLQKKQTTAQPASFILPDYPTAPPRGAPGIDCLRQKHRQEYPAPPHCLRQQQHQRQYSLQEKQSLSCQSMHLARLRSRSVLLDRGLFHFVAKFRNGGFHILNREFLLIKVHFDLACIEEDF